MYLKKKKFANYSSLLIAGNDFRLCGDLYYKLHGAVIKTLLF